MVRSAIGVLFLFLVCGTAAGQVFDPYRDTVRGPAYGYSYQSYSRVSPYIVTTPQWVAQAMPATYNADGSREYPVKIASMRTAQELDYPERVFKDNKGNLFGIKNDYWCMFYPTGGGWRYWYGPPPTIAYEIDRPD